MVGGIASGLYQSLMTWWLNLGTWLPWNLAASLIPDFRPATPGLQASTAAGFGLVLILSAILGLIMGRLGIGLLRTSPPGPAVLFGLAWGTAAWLISGLAARVLESPLGTVLPWHYLLGHLLGGAVAALLLRGWAGGRSGTRSPVPRVALR